MGRKKLKLADGKKDRISDLPDCLIHHILSFLPSTKQTIQTGILSKRWQNQWTRVPVLIFNSNGMSSKNYVNFINNTVILHDCSKIKKFHLYLDLFKLKQDPEIDSKFRFATSKNVEDFDLDVLMDSFYLLPQFLFNNASLVRLKLAGCRLVPNGNISWGFLTLLIIRDCKLTEKRLARILSGCPLLESLELAWCSEFDKIIIASKSLKKLVLTYFTLNYISVLKISCPKLEELSLNGIYTNDPKLFARAIERVLSSSALLESMSIQSIHCHTFDKLVIASKYLKRLVLGDISSIFDMEISCPKLETLKLVGCLNVNAAKLLNLPSSLCATIDFHQFEKLPIMPKSLIEDILQQLQHIEKLKIGNQDSFHYKSGTRVF